MPQLLSWPSRLLTGLALLLCAALLSAPPPGSASESADTQQTNRNRIFLPLVQRGGTTSPTPAPTPAPPVAPTGERWSNPATWPNGRVPAQGEMVTIPAGKTVLLDVSPPALRSIQLDGTLLFDNRDLNLTLNYIMLHGRLAIGSEAAPFRNRATITFAGDDPNENVMNMGSRGLLLMGGRLELFGVSPAPVWTKLNDHAEANATSLTLRDSVNWRAGDQLAIAPTDFYGVAATERLAVASASGATVSLSGPLRAFRWGRLQHLTASGMSLTPDPSFTPPATPFPTVLDQRAAVGNLSRNIVIQGADDTLWRTQNFGAQLMAMAGSTVQIDGVEFRRVGQGGRNGRYPIHFHMLSYDESSGATLADASSSFVRNSAIWQSQNRCIVIHGTNGLRIQNNICNDIRGHAIFLEDAVERRNVIENNLVLMVRVPPQPLQRHDREVFQGGPSGFWITNPDNTVRGNLAADAQGNGFWLSFPRTTLGLSKAVKMMPDRLGFGVFDDNTAHSNRSPGINLDWAPTNDAGDVSPNKYIPTSDGGDDRFSQNRLRFSMRRITTFKNNDHGLWNRTTWPNYEEWVSADNVGTYFAGAGDDGLITRSLLVGTSLNNRSAYPNPNNQPVAFASYHSTFDMRQNVVMNFPFVAGQPSGTFRTDDYYITGVDRGMVRNPGNRLINSHPGYRVLPPNLRPGYNPSQNQNWTFSGALWDAHGYFGPAGNYWTYDNPFLTHGGNCQPVAPAGQNGMSCGGQFYGVGMFLLNRSTNRFSPQMPIETIRRNEVGAEVGRWTVADGSVSTMLGNMRHFAARTGGRYELRFPGFGAVNDAAVAVTNAFRNDDWFILGIQFDGTPAGAYATTSYHYEEALNWQAGNPNLQFRRMMSAAPDLQTVIDSAGDRFWHDAASKLVWVKVRGGMPVPGEANFRPNSDEDLYRPQYVRVYSQP
ncbi:MAG: right-handed parallel beta-helix repeat-containing protein [Chloroflexaceae bacterium]|jgi:hypothetical protein|nr:right-handed parallel beta-helix repeat-containing protein [Chloroflexaceae bacterium]